jgi:hypothetical protein
MKERSIHSFADKQGLKRRVIHAPGALDSWDELSSRKAAQVEGFLIALFDEWIAGSRLHSGWATPEGDLVKGIKYYAIKRIPVRAYFWYSTQHKNTIVISHYVIKKWSKLKTKDTSRVRANWARETAGELK